MATRKITSFSRTKAERSTGEDAKGLELETSKVDASAPGQNSYPHDTAGDENSLIETVRHLLTAGDVRGARSKVAELEAVSLDLQSENGTSLATAKALIALASGDRVAAKAIVTRAIETMPEKPQLRALMSELMMSEGRAADVRSVLRHLGRSPDSDESKAADPDHPLGANG